MRDHASPYSSMAAPGTAAGAATAALVQYVVLREDLARSWSLGAVVAQGCHAALAAAHAHWQHPDTRAYLSEGGAMRTVVLECAGFEEKQDSSPTEAEMERTITYGFLLLNRDIAS
ncbi:putative peptidyl-tRNA hydrolase PTRHD1 isoform X2 [Tympanuchus pallidicinctus]|uniref:putative peptidyl-tRNA hydrolase PTRHD1 isoform X2 n=1 Tax=Tympanuchus pallidicinctus TaxID=109042 RepID=UPI0022875029|nr:putative peptidyl-tRNA hydrolase PTRHD1 isoform X2 [Tympanuchus pallidicinctus]